MLTTELERLHEAQKKKGSSSTTASASAGSARERALTVDAADGRKAAGGTDADEIALDEATRQKLSALYALQTRIEPLLPLAPWLLQRMRSLAGLHAATSGFAARLEGVVRADAQLRQGQEELRALLRAVEGSVQGNEQRVQTNVQALEQRMDALMARLDKLTGAQ